MNNNLINFLDKKMRILAIIIVFIIMLIILLIININKYKNKENSVDKNALKEERLLYENQIENPASVLNGKKPELEQFETVYLSVKDILKSYFEYCNNNDEKALISMLDNEYIKDNNLNNKNILDSKALYKDYEQFIIQDMYSLNGINYYTYYIKGYKEENKYFYIIVNIDTQNNAFSIQPADKSIYEEALDTVIEEKKGKEKNIEKNDFNEYNPVKLKENGIAEAYMEDFKERVLINKKLAYDLLDNEYKRSRFPIFSDFKSYVDNNKEKIEGIMIKKYAYKNNDNKKQYICVDLNDNQYTFNISSAMKYSILLDNYTVLSEEFKNNYLKLNEKEKVSTNIDRFIKCINNNDYSQAYSFLDENFKNNYFNDLNKFENYIKDNYYENNYVKDINIENEGNIFISTITLKSGVAVSSRSTTKKINMKLEDNLYFKISFEVE